MITNTMSSTHLGVLAVKVYTFAKINFGSNFDEFCQKND